MFCSLIIFVKNPVEGQVKTRVAASVGHTKAVEVYVELLKHTRNVVSEILNRADSRRFRVSIYYGDYVNTADLWDELNVQKYLQTGNDLGERMKNAFANELAAGAASVVIVGSDCLELKPAHLETAFGALANADVVIGPALDGGYYLLGMNELQPFLFENKPWSQSNLLEVTETELTKKNVNYQLLEPLSDIDTWDDYLLATKRNAEYVFIS